ncbi:metal-dependent hydrolase [Snodgrassella sp. CFCC 13594]|uniref:metal-dependent hydrolase n=1 Tax=Snodgrassella sp. CFCC 13594 TaxID=1775559 RepID=UPI000831A70F|nr:metal-dependent hydrolase [Snodgrassella sp. CFCC 13594]
MDSLTQIALGATVQGIGLGRYQGRKSLAYGAILATLPDLDVFIRYTDPVSQMTLHRGFSHSLLVLPLLALVLAWAIKKKWPNTHYSFARLYWTLCFTLITHPLLDAFTVYGTQLFWPLEKMIGFSPQQWSGVFIVDPLYTVPLLMALSLALWVGLNKKAIRWLSMALVWSTVYLAWGTYGQYHHEQRVRAYLTQQGIHVTRIMAVPMPLNTLVFRVVAQTSQNEYIDAVSGWLDTAPPEYIMEPLGQQWAAILADNADYQQLNWFADGWLRVDKIGHALVVTDLRMGVPGYHNFRFVLAQQQHGAWRNILPQRYVQPQHLNTVTGLQLIWQRMWSNQLPLPLARWAQAEDHPQP